MGSFKSFVRCVNSHNKAFKADLQRLAISLSVGLSV